MSVDRQATIDLENASRISIGDGVYAIKFNGSLFHKYDASDPKMKSLFERTAYLVLDWVSNFSGNVLVYNGKIYRQSKTFSRIQKATLRAMLKESQQELGFDIVAKLYLINELAKEQGLTCHEYFPQNTQELLEHLIIKKSQ